MDLEKLTISNKKHYDSYIGDILLKLYAIYSPPEHSPDKIDFRQPE